jgi:ferredoxin
VSNIKGTPGPGLCYDPNNPVYWNEGALREELERVFDICNGCRLCFNLCPSFPALFDAVEKHDGDVRKIEPAERDRIIDTCFQCRICYVKCPYTPDDGHAFQLDFPRLMIRANAVRRKQRGIPLPAKVLARPEMLGEMAHLTPRLANWANRQPVPGAPADGEALNYYNDLLDQWAKAAGEEIAAKAPSWRRAEAPAVEQVSFAVSTTIDDLIQGLETGVRAPNDVLDELRRIVGGVTVELDGAALGSTPGMFKATPGMHQLRVTRQWMKPWQQTVNIQPGAAFNIALELSEDGLRRYQSLEGFRAAAAVNCA